MLPLTLLRTMMERFWSKVNMTDDCWLWTAAVCKSNGYGKFGLRGKTPDAHRVAWELVFGEIPSGMLVCHKCDVKLCVRPDHLFLGTHRDNMRDAVSKGRLAHGDNHYSRKNPERCHLAKLTWEKVDAIRADHAAGLRSPEIALKHGITRDHVYPIIHGKIWKRFQEAKA